MKKERKLCLLIIAFTMLFLLTPQSGDVTSHLDSTLEPEMAKNPVQTVLDPTITKALADSGLAQRVSLRTTHELNAEEITQLENQGVTFRKRDGQVVQAGCIYLVEISAPAALDALVSVGYVEQIEADSDLNNIQLDQSVSDMGTNLAYTLRDPILESQNITGHGVTVAIIDTGIDWQHPDFYFADGGEYYFRFDAVGGYYIDLNDNSAYDAGEKSYYFDLPGDGGSVSVFDPAFDWRITDTNGNGATYDYGIDHAYVANDLNGNGVLEVGETCLMLGTCKISKIWDQTTGNFYVRGVNLTNPAINTHVDTNGHGTHVAGTVAGGQFGYRTFVGVAPNAEIMIIKTTFSSLDIIDSVIWAVNEGANVISMSIGGYIHRPLDGSSSFEQIFDWAYDQGVPSTVSAGNSANDDIHSLMSLPASTESTIRFQVTSTGQTVVYLTTLWRSPSNSLSLRIQSPYLIIPSPIFSIPLDGSTVNVENNLVSAYRYTSSRDTAYITISITYQSPLTEIETGIWTLYLNNPAISSQYTHTYIYPAGANEMVDYIDAAYTVSSPATADHVIAIASYVTKLGGSSVTLGDISVFSSIGPRIDGLLKPEIAAPGELIMSTDSGDAGGFPGGHVTMQGTSMACPHAAGVLALEFQCHPAGMPFSSSSLRSDLLMSADEDAYTGSVPNIFWGYGKIDAYEAVVRESPDVGPIISEVTVDDVPIADYHSTEVVRGEWFTLSVLATDDQSYLDLSVIIEYSEAGGPVEGSFPLTYDSASGRWNVSLYATAVAELVTFNFTFIVSDPLFSADPHTVFVDVLNELPTLQATYLNETSVLRTQAIEFAVDASDYHDGYNIQVVLCLQRPDTSWLNVSMNWNGSLFVSSILFNATDQLGLWNVYVQVSDQDGGVITESNGSFVVLNNVPSVSGSLVSGTVSIGDDILIDAVLDDVEDTWLFLRIRLKDSSNVWYNYTIYTNAAGGIFSRPSDGLYPGIYEAYLVVIDGDGSSFQVYVDALSLVDTAHPTISEPLDVNYSESDTGYSISWNASDLHPTSYIIYLEGIPVLSGAWNSSSEFFVISVDGLGLGSHNYTIVVTDVGGNTTSDTVFVHVTDGTDPNIDPPVDVQYDEFSTGYSIVWNPSDAHPVSYVIYLEGSTIKSGAWNTSAETITISVDGHLLGVYNYTLLVVDIGGNSATDEVLVTVVDGIAPTIDNPADMQYDEFDTGYSITWDPSDFHPANYVIYLNTSLAQSGVWNITSETITVTVVGHELGVYNYTITVIDVGGNTASDTVFVTVVDGTIPTIDSPIDVEYIEGDTGNAITWSPTDLHPLSYEIFRDGVSFGSNVWSLPMESIMVSVDGLSPGEYNYTIVVTDVGGNVASDTVMVAVTVESTTPTTDTTTDTTTTTSPPPSDMSAMIIVIVGAGGAIVAIIIILLIKKKKT